MLSILSFEEIPWMITAMLPTYDGDLFGILRRNPNTTRMICTTMLYQMLSALNFLNKVIHQPHLDVRPENIVYRVMAQNRFRFRLTNFCRINQAVDMSGPERYYMAPEHAMINIGQSAELTDKTDIWSLYATFIAAHPRFDFPPDDEPSHQDTIGYLRANARFVPPGMRGMVKMFSGGRPDAETLLNRLFIEPRDTEHRNSSPHSDDDFVIDITQHIHAMYN